MLYYGKQRNNRCGLPLTNRDYRFKRRGGQVVDGQATATVASYFRAWIPGLIEPKYDCHKFTLRPNFIGNRIPRAATTRLSSGRSASSVESSKPLGASEETGSSKGLLYDSFVQVPHE